MKIQELAIVFILIIFPISLLLSEYTQFQIKTLNMQTEYDSKLTAATYDAIKAFQINAKNETYSAMINPKMENIEASVNAFRNSIKSTFELNGYSEEDINSYIPALVFTLYDGFYIYSPYQNINYRYEIRKVKDASGNYVYDASGNPIYEYDADGNPVYELDASGNKIMADGNGENAYGLKSFITYSCRYLKGSTDVVITYALDNYITVEGMVNGEYVSKGGYLIDNINVSGENVTYNGVTIEAEKLMEYVPRNNQVYPYAKINGTKYYFMENYFPIKDANGIIVDYKDSIVYISNGIPYVQAKEDDFSFESYMEKIMNNENAKEYYKQAYEFTDWFYNETNLGSLTYGDAYDQMVNEDGETVITYIWPGDTTKIFEDDDGRNVENELSNFNQHRLKVIRRKIEVNLAIAIANYNSYSNVENVFQMPLIKEDEWDQIINNISLISFLQGLPIGGKIYNGYTLVTNSESEEVVNEEYIYILGDDGSYHKVGDKGFSDGTVKVNAGYYQGNTDAGGEKYRSAGRVNLDFESVMLLNDDKAFYYYPLKNYNASYNSVVMQNKINTYDDIYEYVNSCNANLKKAFYTALGRERASKYNTNISIEM